MSVSKLIKSTALHLIGLTAFNTSSGNWTFELSDFCETDEERKFFKNKGNMEELLNEISSYDAVAEVGYDNSKRIIDITLYTDYCWSEIE